MLICNCFHFWNIFVQFKYQHHARCTEHAEKCFLLLSVKRVWCDFFYKCLIEFTNETTLTSHFLCGKVFEKFNFLTNIPLLSLNASRTCGVNNFSFSPDFVHLHSFPFFLISLDRVSWILFIFLKKQLCPFFLLPISLISVPYYFLPF